MLGPLIIVSGPSGSGKSTVIAEVLKVCKQPIRVAVTATTRQKREGERDGVDYHFWTRERFIEEIAAGSLLEHAIVHGKDFYGTPLSEVDPYRLEGKGVMLVIDVQGAATVRGKCPGVFSIFLNAPDLLQRLVRRGELPENIEKRLATAKGELDRANEYSVVLVNENLQETVDAMCKLIEQRFRQ
jgi:guanylate kinase